ncbi:MAG TPA: ATP-grasp domain-containing protein [Vicinamibacterales bacterium]|nr:ATP-grasp domain-containing protein [Vicinamibacterales bacterium]HOQ60550.1 ATP-grasp domain-containing protein [Vicinamibacterales bacterium]HPK70413.1 ATP-grasp domain-containing protein [Vicinamibacterales bacterium]
MLNVLFTSAGRRVELLRAFRKAYATLGLDGRVVAVDMDPLAPALGAADRAFIVPRLSAPDYIDALSEVCRRERVKVVFPLIDPDIPVLAANRAALEAAGARPAVVSAEAAAIAADKWRCSQFFAGLGLETPRSWLVADLARGGFDYPLFVKPRRGSAAVNAFAARNPRELEFFTQYVPDAVVQEFLPGPEITSDVVCDLDGGVLAVVSRQRIEVRWGEVAKGVTVSDPRITEACVAIARALPAVGPITVQCMMKDGAPRFTEINARLGGGAPLGIAAGADWPCWLLARCAGVQVEVPPLGSYRTGTYLTRFDESVFMTEAERDEIARRRL